MAELGQIDILNVGLGDLKVRFNPNDPADVEKAQSMIEKMLRQGYAICIEEPDGTYKRVKRFDKKRDCYIVTEVAGVEEEEQEERPKATRAGRKNSREVARPRAKTRATAIGRSAGG